MRTKRAGGLAVVVALIVSGLVGGKSASAADPAVLSVPVGELGGVVSVTASADPLTHPFVQVGLVLGNVTTFPAQPITGIDPAPVVNPLPGGSLTMTVPTWGVHGQAGTFVLMGCLSSNKATCTTPLAWTTRSIQQSNQATASIDVPTSPVFVPQEAVQVTTANTGGGRMIGDLSGEGVEVVLPNVGTTDWTTYAADYGQDTLRVRRCSTLADDRAYCEPLASAGVNWVRELVIDFADVYGYGLGFVTTDPAIPATSAEVSFTPHAMGRPYDLSWELRETGGPLVVGPVQVADDETAPTIASVVSPIAHAGGAGIPDGDYDFVVRGSTRKGGWTKQAVHSVTLSVLNDPPLETGTLVGVDRIQRPKDAAHPENKIASYSVAALTDRPGYDAEFEVRNRAGEVVYTEQVTEPCPGYDAAAGCLSDGLAWDFRAPTTSAQQPLLAPGAYTVTARIPDQFGREVNVGLGRLEVQRLASVKKVVKVESRKSWTAAGRVHTGKVKVPLPAFDDSYYSLNKTVVKLGFKGSSRSVQDRQTACASTAGKLTWKRFRPLGDSGDKVCRLTNSSWRGLPTRGVQVKARISHGAQLRVTWVKVVYHFRGYVTP